MEECTFVGSYVLEKGVALLEDIFWTLLICRNSADRQGKSKSINPLTRTEPYKQARDGNEIGM